MCKHCEGDRELYYDNVALVMLTGDGISVLVLDEDLELYRFAKRLPIRFCPMCGKDLRGESE